jgi:hypothetical protein
MRLPFFFALFWVGFAPSLAYAEIVNTADVMVDVAADNATNARDKAFAEGEQMAFKQIIEKMAPDQADSIIKSTPASRVSALVVKNEMLEEKMSGNRYRATLRYTFHPRGLARVLGTPVEETQKPADAKAMPTPPTLRDNAMLVLPVWNDGGVFRLWENENIWRLIWNSVILQRGEGVLIAPFVDERDKIETDGLRAIKSDFTLLEPLAAKYGAKQIGLMLANIDTNDPKQALKVTLKTLTSDGELDPRVFEYSLRPNETLNMQMQRAAQDIALKLRRERNGESGALDEQINTLDVRMQGVSMKDWQAIRAKLLKVPAMQSVELVKMSYFDTTLKLTYRGTPELLGKMLAAAGFRLFKDGNMLVLALS